MIPIDRNLSFLVKKKEGERTHIETNESEWIGKNSILFTKKKKGRESSY